MKRAAFLVLLFLTTACGGWIPPIVKPQFSSFEITVTCGGQPAVDAELAIDGLGEFRTGSKGTYTATIPTALPQSHLFVVAPPCLPYDTHLDLPRKSIQVDLMSALRVEVVSGGRPITGARVEVHGLKVFTTDESGIIVAEIPGTLPQSHLFVQADGYYTYDRHLELPFNETIRVVLEPTFVPLPVLLRYRQFFRLSTGVPFTIIQTSDFNLLNRWQHGEDITPILAQRRDLGFNTLRVWTLYNLPPDPKKPGDEGIGVFLDIDYGRIGAFLDLCAKYGFYVEFTAYTSTERPDHWGKLVEAVRGKSNVLLELVNEEDQKVNNIDLTRYLRPTGVFASHGSNGSQSEPVRPFWDYATFHTNGAFEEQRKVGHNAMELSDGPVVTNETSRYPDVGMWADASRERQKLLAFDAAAGAALLAAGSCFHSIAGKTSRLFSSDEAAVAAAWAAGARSVDLACQDGLYYHREGMETPELLRVYERPVVGHACIVRIRK